MIGAYGENGNNVYWNFKKKRVIKRQPFHQQENATYMMYKANDRSQYKIDAKQFSQIVYKKSCRPNLSFLFLCKFRLYAVCQLLSKSSRICQQQIKVFFNEKYDIEKVCQLFFNHAEHLRIYIQSGIDWTAVFFAQMFNNCETLKYLESQ